LSLSLDAEAADYTSSQTGNWDVAATWGGAGTPGAGDTATIGAVHTVTLTQAEECTTLNINNLGTLNCVTYDLTVSEVTYVNTGGVLNSGSGAMSFGSGYTTNYGLRVQGGTFTGGSGVHTMGGFYLDGGAATFSSGTTTIDSVRTLNTVAWAKDSGTTWDDGDGTIKFTLAGDQKIYSENGDAVTFHSVEVNKASGDLEFYTDLGFDLTVDNDLILTAGEFETFETDGTACDLTVSGDVFIAAGTLDCNAGSGTVSAAFGTLTINASGTYEATPGTTRISGDLSNSGTFTHNDGTIEMYFAGSGTSHFYGSLTGSNAFYNLKLSTTGALTVSFSIDIEIQHDVTLGDGVAVLHLIGTNTLTLGTASYASQVSGIRIYGNSAAADQYLYGADASYPAVIDCSLRILTHASYAPINLHLKWVDIVGAKTTPGNSRTATLEEDCSFGSLTISTSDTLDLNTHKAMFSGTFTDTGTLTSGTTSEINLTASGSWTLGQNASLHSCDVDGYLTIPAGKVLTFTNTTGFETSTGEINVTGSQGDLARVTGPAGWEINSSALADYWFWYANFTEGSNTGSKTLVALGEGYNLTGSWDFAAPAITSHVITEGHEQNLYDNTTLIYDWTATDLTFLRDMNFTIYCTDNDTLMLWGDLNLTTNETAANRWNLTTTISTWTNGTYNITFRTSDCHNPAKTKEAREKAEKMTVIAGGEVVGSKHKKETEFVPGLDLIFNNEDVHLEQIFVIEFLETKEQDLEHKVKWKDRDKNFKIYHRAKVGEVDGKKKKGDAGAVPRILGVKMKISADSLEYIPRSEYLGHFLINGAYFYDCQDFAEEGGSLIVYEKERSGATESYTLIFTHPGWEKNEWVTIDPMSGSINSNSQTYNFTLTNVAPEVQEEIVDDEDQDRPNLLIPVLVALMMAVSAAGIIYLLTESNTKIAR